MSAIQVKAVSKYVRISPQKVHKLIGGVKGQPVEAGLNMLKFMPQKAAGWRMEPPVSVPVAAGASMAATAAAEPPDEPPGTSFVSHGFRTGP